MNTIQMSSLNPIDAVTQRKLVAVENILSSTKNSTDDVILVVEPEVAAERLVKWRSLMPRVRPFYAVKANNDPQIIKALVRCGSGFDCASKWEIELVLEMGAQAKDIVFSHPAKLESHINYAAEKGVNLMVFDSLEELRKMIRLHPNCESILRITADNRFTSKNFDAKFGAENNEIFKLLSGSKEIGANVVGVHFHMGLGTNNELGVRDALDKAAWVFKMAASMGIEMRLLDIGGGFSGLDDEDAKIPIFITKINEGLKANFPDASVNVIAEPGRFIASRTSGILLKVVNKRLKLINSSIVANYYFNDGIFGNLLYLQYFPHSNVVFFTKSPVDFNAKIPSVLWGVSMADFDRFGEGVLWPELQVGDRVFFDDTGAYGHSVCSRFNGFGKEVTKFVYL